MFKKYFFVILAIIVVSSVVELCSFIILKFYTNNGTFRIYSPRFTFDPIIGRRMQPNYVSSGESHLTTNNLGRSITPINHLIPDLTIVITGGSSIFQSSSRNNKMSVPSIIERMINDKYKIKAEVINLAIPGYTSFQELMSLHDYFLSEKADIVINISGFNDVTNRFDVVKITDPQIFNGPTDKRYELILDKRYFDKIKVIENLEKGKFIFYNFSYFLRSKSYFFELVDRVLQKLASRKVENTKKSVSDYHKYLEKNLTNEALRLTSKQAKEKARISISHYSMMQSLARSNNSKHFTFLQPSALSWGFFENSNLFKEYLAYEKKLQPRYIKNFNLIYDEIIKQNKLVDELFDFRNIFNSFHKEAFIDHIHYTDYGTNILATKVLETLEKEF